MKQQIHFIWAIHSQLCLLFNLLNHRCLRQTTVPQCVSGEGSSNVHSAMCSNLIPCSRGETLPLWAPTFELTPSALLLPVQDLWSSLITSLHQVYPRPHLCILVKLAWASAAHQPVTHMTAPQLEGLGLADAWKSKEFM